MLRMALALHWLPHIFANEVGNEVGMVTSLGIKMQTRLSSTPSVSEKRAVLHEMLEHLNKGYEYLYQHFGVLYGGRNVVASFMWRIRNKITLKRLKKLGVP
jgi:hypothetical protein